MRAAIDVPFRDAAASQLAWALTEDARPPAGLAHVDVPAGPWGLRLHVLGASHAVELLLPAAARLTETVACGIAGGRPLERAPEHAEASGLRYRFAAEVDVPGTRAVEELAAELDATLSADPHGIVATFPGAPGAATGLRARVGPEGVAWETWHLYPERGEVVRTRSSATAIPSGVAAPGRVPGADRSAAPDRPALVSAASGAAS